MCFLVRIQFDAEFRRFSLRRSEAKSFDEFSKFVEKLHHLNNVQFLVSYVDPNDNDLLPINNDDNYGRAISTARPLLRVIVQRKGMQKTILLEYHGLPHISIYFLFFLPGDSIEEITGYGTMKKHNLIGTILGQTPVKTKTLAISNPHDFRQVSAIIDVDIVPESCRRVRLLKHGSDKPLGFYIR